MNTRPHLPSKVARNAATLLLFVLALSMCGTLAHAAWAAPTNADVAASILGADVARTTVSPTPFLEGELGRIDTIVFLNDPHLMEIEKRNVLKFVASGGRVIAIAPASLNAFVTDATPTLILPGRVFEADGNAAVVDTASGAKRTLLGGRAIDTDGTHLTPRLTTTAGSFRDTNGNGRLEIGEPAGPFVLAIEEQIGEGAIVVLAAEDAGRIEPAMLATLVDPQDPQRILVVDSRGAFGGWSRAWAVGLTMAPGSPAIAMVLAGASALGALLLLRKPSQRSDDAPKLRNAVSTYVEALRASERSEHRAILRELEADAPSTSEARS